MDEPQAVTLRTGAEVPEPIVRTTLMALDALTPIALFELVAACRDSSHALFGRTGTELQSLALVRGLNFDGTADISPTVRDVVLAAAEGDGAELRIVPLAALLNGGQR